MVSSHLKNCKNIISYNFKLLVDQIMGVFTYEMEVTSPLPPARIFKALILEGDKLIPKLLPQAIKSVEILHGDGGPGSIKQINFGEGSQFSYVKHKVESIDEEKFTYVYSVIEGDVLIGKVEKITNETKIEASPEGGSKCKTIGHYYPVGDFELKEEQIKAGKERSLGLFKAVEAYLLANPDAYN